jgi:tetratricopeptide (TPR) repeat protein
MLNLHFAMSTFQWALLMLLAAASSPVAVAQQPQQADVVHRRNGIIVRGKIIANDSKGVRVQLENGKESFVPADDVDRIEVKYTADQEEGERLLEQKKYQAAVERLESALAVESRPWVRARVVAALISAHLATGDSAAACDAFIASSQDPKSQVAWSIVPAWWLATPPDGAMEQRAGALMRSASPLHQVLGASYLFGTDRSDAARDTLAKLATYPDDRIAQLARVQLWRWQAATAKAEDVAAWQRHATKLPAELRGGPYFAIGLALRRLGQHDEAALAFLWPALVYRSDLRLSQQATLLAAQSLEQANEPLEAAQLYRDVMARFPSSAEAATAAERVKEVERLNR